MKKILIALIRLYQMSLSPFLGQHCRFTPSWSHYAIECLQIYGVVKGFWLMIKRLSRCHPWHVGGYDAVPSADFKSDLQPAPKSCCNAGHH